MFKFSTTPCDVENKLYEQASIGKLASRYINQSQLGYISILPKEYKI